jgi:hypothetical protein
MPRVTVNKESLAVTPLPSPVPSPAPELTQPELLSDAPLPIQEAPVTPSPAPAPAVQQIIRQIKSVLIEVPLCDNPPGLDGTPSFCKAHVNFNLVKSRSANGWHLLHRLWWALKENGAALANGRKIHNRSDAVIWLIEQLGADSQT